MTPDQRAMRAVGVRALLDDQNVQDALASIEADLKDEWKACQDPHERDNLWRAVNIIERLKLWLTTAASADLSALRRTGRPAR